MIPGIAIGVRSGSATEAISQTTARSAAATEAPPPIQPRSTGHGSSFQRASAPRVRRTPRASAYSLRSTA